MAQQNPKLIFGKFLRFWRGVHQLSQEQLANLIESSTRHIIRLENGDSRPSEAIIEKLAKALSLGERDRNHLRIAAGYGALQNSLSFHSPQLKWLRKSMLLSLKAMDPYPSVLMDGTSRILMVNRAWVSFYRQFFEASKLERVDNHFEFLFSQEGIGPMMQQWEDTVSLILMFLTQSAMLSGDPATVAVLERLKAKNNVPKDWQKKAAKLEPMASFKLQIEYQGKPRTFYSVNQTVGALGPTAYVSEPVLTISTLFPEDETLDMNKSISVENTVKHPLLFY